MVAQRPARHANHQKLDCGRRPQLEERDPVLRDSGLTFAAVWDPETGALQSFSGDSLGKLSNYVDEPTEKELPRPPVPPKSWCTAMRISHWQSQFDRTKPLGRPPYTRNNTREPEASLLFSDSDSIATIPSVYSDDGDTLYGHWRPAQHGVYGAQQSPGNRLKSLIPLTPGSQMTFAALWDPRIGFCTLKDGVLVPVSDTPPRPENRPSKLLYDDGDYYGGDWEADSDPTLTNSDFPGTPPDSHRAFPSTATTLRKPSLPASASQLSFDYPAQYATFCDTPKRDTASKLLEHHDHLEDDEGFFDSFGSHSDCEPHLPSRFSTTTFYTSSSRYLNADLTSVATPGANSLTFPSAAALDARAEYYRNGAIPDKPKSLHSSEEPVTPKVRVPTRKISLPASRVKEQVAAVLSPGSFKPQPPLPRRVSNALRATWSLKRRPTQEEEKWVLVDVRAVGK